MPVSTSSNSGSSLPRAWFSASSRVVRELRLRVHVAPAHPRVRGRGVEVPPVLLGVLAVIALGAREAEDPLLEDTDRGRSRTRARSRASGGRRRCPPARPRSSDRRASAHRRARRSARRRRSRCSPRAPCPRRARSDTARDDATAHDRAAAPRDDRAPRPRDDSRDRSSRAAGARPHCVSETTESHARADRPSPRRR